MLTGMKADSCGRVGACACVSVCGRGAGYDLLLVRAQADQVLVHGFHFRGESVIFLRLRLVEGRAGVGGLRHDGGHAFRARGAFRLE